MGVGDKLSLPKTTNLITIMADSRLALSQSETALQSNAVYHWLGANLESALMKLSFMSST